MRGGASSASNNHADKARTISPSTSRYRRRAHGPVANTSADEDELPAPTQVNPQVTSGSAIPFLQNHADGFWHIADQLIDPSGWCAPLQAGTGHELTAQSPTPPRTNYLLQARRTRRSLPARRYPSCKITPTTFGTSLIGVSSSRLVLLSRQVPPTSSRPGRTTCSKPGEPGARQARTISRPVSIPVTVVIPARMLRAG